MIFVTVGTHEQAFNRLLEEIDDLKKENKLVEPVFIQSGYSTLKPKYCEYKAFLSYDEMNSYVEKADIIITHGGPSSFIMALQHKKIPIVVPRRKEFNEHINDHQLEFCQYIYEHKKNIILVTDLNDLLFAINSLKDKSLKKEFNFLSNTDNFNKRLQKTIDNMFEG